MSKVSKVTKKYLLVSLDDVEDQRGMSRKLRRYLNSHKLSFLFATGPEEMKSYVDKVFKESLNFEEMAAEQMIYDGLFDGSLIGASSNQEILEKWARGENPSGTEALQLIFGQSEQDEPMNLDDDEESHGGSDNEQADKELEREIDNCMPKLFSVDSTEMEGKKEDVVVFQSCRQCKVEVDVGKTRNTRIKRQSLHVLHSHFDPKFEGLDINQRYECQRCHRFVPVQKSLCDHINDCHFKEKDEITFTDLWDKEQLAMFNMFLDTCFKRQLPIPRSRRTRFDEGGLPKCPYRITPRAGVEQQETNEKEKEKPPCVAAEETPQLSDSLLVIDDDEMPVRPKNSKPTAHDHSFYCVLPEEPHPHF